MNWPRDTVIFSIVLYCVLFLHHCTCIMHRTIWTDLWSLFDTLSCLNGFGLMCSIDDSKNHMLSMCSGAYGNTIDISIKIMRIEIFFFFPNAIRRSISGMNALWSFKPQLTTRKWEHFVNRFFSEWPLFTIFDTFEFFLFLFWILFN